MSRERARPIALVALGIVVVAVVVLLSLDDSDDDTATVTSAAAQLTTPGDLGTLGDEVGHPIYWVGERAGTKLELNRETEGEIYVRYLSGDAEPGDPSTAFLTVGTYLVGDAVKVVRRAAREAGARVRDIPGGGIAFLSPESETSAYVAFPGSEVQVEVYDPVQGRALELVEAGRVVPAG